MCQPQIGFRQHESDLTLILNWRNSRHSLSLFCSSFCFFSLFFCAQNMWCLMRCRYALLQFHRKRRAYRGKSAYRGVSVCCSQQTNVICMHVSVSAHFRCRAKCARDARGKASVCSFCSVCFADLGKCRAYRGVSVCCSRLFAIESNIPRCTGFSQIQKESLLLTLTMSVPDDAT